MPARLKISKFIPLFFTFILLSGCVSIYNPATERREMLLIDTQKEISLGTDIDKQLQGRITILKDDQMQARLDSISRRVALASDRQDLAYTFRIAKDKELNAFAIPGGFVYVNTGLLLAATDDELACVLAHEIGHVASKHSIKKLQAALGYQLIMSIALGISGKQAIASAADVFFNLTSQGYSRQDELFADKLSVRYSRRAGFNPYGMVTFFEKLKKEAEKRGPSFSPVFLSSHPAIEERIKKVKEEIALNP